MTTLLLFYFIFLLCVSTSSRIAVFVSSLHLSSRLLIYVVYIFCSDSVAVDSKTETVSSGGGISSSQPVSGQQTAWFGAAGQMSMADIVKMGRPHNKTTNSHKNHEHEIAANQHVPVKDQWPSIEKPMAAASTASVSVVPTESEICSGPADYQSSRGDQQLKGHLEDTQLANNGPLENLGRDQVLQDDTVAGGVIPEDESGVSSEFEDNPYRHETTQKHPVEHQKGMNKCFQQHV